MKTISKNKKAYFDYNILDEYICGIVLLGSETKPIKNNKSSIKESYCFIKKNEIFINGMHIPNDRNNIYPHDVIRDKKLLLNKKEIKQIRTQIEEKGLTLIPLSINLVGSLVKIKIGVCRGKKNYDKRNAIKEKDIKRDIKREIKNN